MIKSITVTNPLNQSLKLILTDPDESYGFEVWDVTGLGPVNATINTTPYALDDGDFFNSARVGMRNIVLTLGLRESESIEETRLRSYAYFPLKGKVRIQVETDSRLYWVDGWVEKNEPDIFSTQESIQVSIIADPYFKSEPVEASYILVTPAFEFPFENTPLGSSNLELSTMTTVSRINVQYPVHSVRTGFIAEILCTGSVTFPGIKNNTPTPNELIEIDTSRLSNVLGGSVTAFSAGDRIVINTIAGQKSAKLYRGANVYNLLNIIPRTSSWVSLYPGDNEISTQATTGANAMLVKLRYESQYQGV